MLGEPFLLTTQLTLVVFTFTCQMKPSSWGRVMTGSEINMFGGLSLTAWIPLEYFVYGKGWVGVIGGLVG